jgi:hypothetical protein
MWPTVSSVGLVVAPRLAPRGVGSAMRVEGNVRRSPPVYSGSMHGSGEREGSGSRNETDDLRLKVSARQKLKVYRFSTSIGVCPAQAPARRDVHRIAASPMSAARIAIQRASAEERIAPHPAPLDTEPGLLQARGSPVSSVSQLRHRPPLGWNRMTGPSCPADRYRRPHRDRPVRGFGSIPTFGRSRSAWWPRRCPSGRFR